MANWSYSYVHNYNYCTQHGRYGADLRLQTGYQYFCIRHHPSFIIVQLGPTFAYCSTVYNIREVESVH